VEFFAGFLSEFLAGRALDRHPHHFSKSLAGFVIPPALPKEFPQGIEHDSMIDMQTVLLFLNLHLLLNHHPQRLAEEADRLVHIAPRMQPPGSI
jgi:hypothetical protein